MKILLITSRNVYSTSGELRLIKNRTETLLDAYGIETDVVFFKKASVQKNKQEVFRYKSFTPYMYGLFNHYSVFRKFRNDIKQRVSSKQYDTIVISGLFLTNIPKYLRSIGCDAKIIIDVHGASEELLEFKGKTFVKSMIRRISYLIINHYHKVTYPLADGFYVVSAALKDYVINSVKGLESKAFFIIPCGLAETEINQETSIKNRKFYRDKYGISDNELLFIYSGGVSPWQCIDESVNHFIDFRKRSSKPCRMLILSGNLNSIEQYRRDGIILDSYSGDEVRKVLCAGDYAFLLRGDYVTNHVAYPNKFLEYVASGMKVIATKNVYDVATQIEKYKVGVIINSNDVLYEIINSEKEQVFLDDLENRNSLLKATSFETTLKPFIQYMKS